MKADAPLTCELCCGTTFTDVYLPQPGGVSLRSGLMVCVACRLVFLPKPAAPRFEGTPSFGGFGNYGPVLKR
jgi:hypothetical protein